MDLVTHAVSGAVIGAALAPNDRTRLPLAIVGAVASLMPDLDALSRKAGAAAAWRHHRVALHGLPVVPALALCVAAGQVAGSRLGFWPAVPALALALTATAGVVAHLLLDTLTSFGTALLYPFSRRRFSTHTHFIVDAGLLLTCCYGLIGGRPAFALFSCGVGISLSIVWRSCLQVGARRAFERSYPGMVMKVSVEPGPMSPLRWTAVASLTNGRARIANTSLPGWLIRDVDAPSGDVPALALERAGADPLVAAYLDTVDFLHVEWTGRKSSPELLIEDLKWRIHGDVRPMSLSVPWRGSRPVGVAKEHPMFWRPAKSRA